MTGRVGDASLAVAGNQSTTIDVLRDLVDAGYRFSYLVCVGPAHAHKIADYVDLADTAAELGIPLLRPATYEMNDPETREMFEDVNIDLLVSVGWQRLIPGWLLSRLRIGAFGMHGSADPLPMGRGRSPMNWSIIEGRDRFLTNLFRYDEGVDSGLIVATQRFDVEPWDTIRSLQHKNAIAQAQLLIEHLPALLDGTATLRPQPDDVRPTYYPKRVPDDGVLDWRDTPERLDRIVRAVTRPYPGAFTICEGVRVYVWGGAPFDRSLGFGGAEPGTVVAVFHDGSFVVQCGAGSYYVTDWQASPLWRPRRGDLFQCMENQSWRKLESMALEQPTE